MIKVGLEYRTRESLVDEKYEYIDYIDYCEERGLEGVIKKVKRNGEDKIENWYVDDLKNWVEEYDFLLRNEEVEEC